MAEVVNHIDTQEGAFLMTRPGYYFGYGLESVPVVMDMLLGRSVTAEVGVTAVQQQLVVQEIDQVPDEPTEQLGGKSPQQILADTWRQYTDVPFSSYSTKPTDNRSDIVKGTLYEIDLDDGIRLADWGLVLPFERKDGNFFWPAWKVWDHDVELSDGRVVETLTIDSEQAIDRVVDGVNYDPFLIDPQVTYQAIEGFVQRLAEE